MTEKKVLVTGASGLLGRAVYKYFINENFRKSFPLNDNSDFTWNCVATTINLRIKDGLIQLDLTDFDKVQKFLEELRPDAIVHCAAEKKIENIEKNYEDSLKLNCDSTSFLAEYCAKNRIVFVYISTDYVFDGNTPPYKTDAQTNPLSKYGQTKLQGEKVTQQASENHCIIRVPVLYGHTEPNGFNESAINILYEIIKKLQHSKQDNIQTRFPTHCIDVARFIMKLLIKRFQEGDKIKGIFHCSALENYTKYEMSCIIADLFGIDKIHIEADEKITPQLQLRPMNSQLDTEYSYKLIDFIPIMKFKDSIKDCLENFV